MNRNSNSASRQQNLLKIPGESVRTGGRFADKSPLRGTFPVTHTPGVQKAPAGIYRIAHFLRQQPFGPAILNPRPRRRVAEVRTALANHMSMLETQESEAQHVTAQRIISHCGLNCATSILGQMRPWLTFNPLPAECLKDFLDAYVYRQNMPRMELEQLAFIGGPRGISELTEAYEQSLAARTQLAWSIQELQLKQQAVEKAAPRADILDPALIMTNVTFRRN